MFDTFHLQQYHLVNPERIKAMTEVGAGSPGLRKTSAFSRSRSTSGVRSRSASASAVSTTKSGVAFAALPAEWLLLCCNQLTVSDLLAMSGVCKHWSEVSARDSVWKPRYLQRWDADSAQSSRIAAGGAWKQRFRVHARVALNWAHQHFAARSIHLQGLSAPVNCMRHDAASARLTVCTNDGAIRVHDLQSGLCLRKLTGGHDGEVLSVASDARLERIVTGGFDALVCVWDGGSGRLLQQLKAHSAPVASVELCAPADRVASGSSDRSVCVWALSSGELLHTLRGHASEVDCVQMNAEFVVSAGADQVTDLSSALNHVFAAAAL